MDLEKIRDEISCPVCFQLKKDPYTLQSCFHTVCFECISKILVDNQIKCPLCKSLSSKIGKNFHLQNLTNHLFTEEEIIGQEQPSSIISYDQNYCHKNKMDKINRNLVTVVAFFIIPFTLIMVGMACGSFAYDGYTVSKNMHGILCDIKNMTNWNNPNQVYVGQLIWDVEYQNIYNPTFIENGQIIEAYLSDSDYSLLLYNYPVGQSKQCWYNAKSISLQWNFEYTFSSAGYVAIAFLGSGLITTMLLVYICLFYYGKYKMLKELILQ